MLTLVQTPNGRFHFVGIVHFRLAFERLDGEPLTDQDIADIKHVGAGFLKHRIKSRSWKTEEAARAAERRET